MDELAFCIMEEIIPNIYSAGGCDRFGNSGYFKLKLGYSKITNQILVISFLMSMEKEDINKRDVIIIGSGPAGLTAATYLSRGGFKPLLITGSQVGGQLILTNHVENFPGFELISGIELMGKMRKQAENFGTEIVTGSVSEISKVELLSSATSGGKESLINGNSGGGFLVKTAAGKQYQTRSVLVAAGASARWLAAPGVGQFKNKGISACAVCDGPFFKDKVIAVIGGGDTAFTEIEFLSRFVKKIYLIHRRENFRAEKILQERALGNKKVIPIYNSTVLEFLGDRKLTGLKLASKFEVESNKYVNQVKNYPGNYGDNEFKEVDRDRAGLSWTLPVEGAFIAIGFKPNTEFLKACLPARQGFIRLDARGYISVKDGVFTSVPGVFAAGDCADFKYRQAITAAGAGCKAAIEIVEYLKKYQTPSTKSQTKFNG